MRRPSNSRAFSQHSPAYHPVFIQSPSKICERPRRGSAGATSQNLIPSNLSDVSEPGWRKEPSPRTGVRIDWRESGGAVGETHSAHPEPHPPLRFGLRASRSASGASCAGRRTQERSRTTPRTTTHNSKRKSPNSVSDHGGVAPAPRMGPQNLGFFFSNGAVGETRTLKPFGTGS